MTHHTLALVGALSVLALATSPARAEEATQPSTPTTGQPAHVAEPPPPSATAQSADEAPERAASDATAQDEAGDSSRRAREVDEIQRRIEVLAAEIERLRLGEAAARAEGSQYGLGPAASKVYRQRQGVSLGGYGELLYQNHGDDAVTDRLDFQRAILYAGYKFSDRFVLNTEIEIEHVDEIYLEFAYVDFLWNPALNVRAGLVLLPMGLVNELHEPTVFLGALRPETESRILPSTWRENGIGVFGEVGPVSYRAYVVNGLAGEGFGARGLRGGRQKGANALANDLAGVARVDVSPTTGLVIGGSAYYGQSDQDLGFELPTFVYEAHADLKWRGLEARALFAQATLDNVDQLNGALELTGADSVGEKMQGWYAQLGFDVLSLLAPGEQALVPFVRWEEIDTQLEVPVGFAASDANDLRTLTLGASWLPIDQVVVKAEWQNRVDAADTEAEQFNALVGYIF